MRRPARPWRSIALPVAIAVGLVVGGSTSAMAAPTSTERARIPKARGDRHTGVGVTLGDPMGFSLKHFFTVHHTIQFEAAWLPLHRGAGGVSLDYLWHSRKIGESDIVDALFYVGAGVGFGLWGRNVRGGYDGAHFGGALNQDPVHFGLMLRLPALGLAYHWLNVPMDTALEGAWSPFVIEGREAGFGPAMVSISLKLRYYF